MVGKFTTLTSVVPILWSACQTLAGTFIRRGRSADRTTREILPYVLESRPRVKGPNSLIYLPQQSSDLHVVCADPSLHNARLNGEHVDKHQRIGVPIPARVVNFCDGAAIIAVRREIPETEPMIIRVT